MPAKRTPKKPANAKCSAQEKMNAFGEDAIIDMMREGLGYRAIASEIGVGIARLSDWLAADTERSARAKEARRASADQDDELALNAILAIPDEATSGQIARAREEASHRRWRAKVRDPDAYGDRHAVDLNTNTDTAAMIGQLQSMLIPTEKTDE
jgi:transposase